MIQNFNYMFVPYISKQKHYARRNLLNPYIFWIFVYLDSPYIYIFMLVSLQPGVSISFFGCPSNLHWYLVCFWNKKCQYHGFPADICQFNMHTVLTPLKMTIEIMKLHHLLSTQPFWQWAVCMHHLSHVQCHNFVGRIESQWAAPGSQEYGWEACQRPHPASHLQAFQDEWTDQPRCCHVAESHQAIQASNKHEGCHHPRVGHLDGECQG